VKNFILNRKKLWKRREKTCVFETKRAKSGRKGKTLF